MPLFPFFQKTRVPKPKPPREPYQLEVEGLVAEVRRKPMRTVRMVLRPPEGRIQVSAPLRVSDRYIREFIASRRDWIEAQRLRLAQLVPPVRPRIQSGDRIPLFGRELTLRVEHSGKLVKVGPDPGPDGSLLLRGPATASLERKEAALRRWYARRLIQEAQILLPGYEAALGVHAERLTVRPMRSRWGSCNLRTRTITLALELARRPKESLEYVLVHELAHLIVRSHGPRFKSILQRHLPDWRQRRKAMNDRPLLP